MINTTTNGNMTAASSSSSSGPTTTTQSQQQGLKTYFKTPEGRYKLQFDKTHPSGLLQFNHGKTVSMVCFSNSILFHSFLGFSCFCYYLVQLFLIFTLIALSALSSVCNFILLYVWFCFDKN